MFVREFMSTNPVCCTPSHKVGEAARMMADNDCGALPVVDSLESMRPVGMVTDRDITCRAVARSWDPAVTTVEQCMSSPAVTVTPDHSLDRCCELMETNRVRRLVVVDEAGRCCGMIAQADVCQVAPDDETATLLRRISYPPRTEPRLAKVA